MELFFYALSMGAHGTAVITAAIAIFCFIYSYRYRWDVAATAFVAYLIHLALLPLT